MQNDTDNPGAVRRKRKKASRYGSALILGLIGLLVIAGGIFAMIHFLGTGDEPEMLAYLPPDTSFLICIEAEELMKDERVRLIADVRLPDGVKRFMTKIEFLGIAANDISHVFIGGQRANRDESGGDVTYASCIIVRTLKPFDWEKVKSAMSGSILKTEHGKNYFAAPMGDECIYFPNDYTVVVMGTEAQTIAILAKDPRQITISADMRKLIAEMGKGNIWMVMNQSVFSDQFGDIESHEREKSLDGEPIAAPDSIDALQSMIGFGISLTIEGTEIVCNAQMAFADAIAGTRAEESLRNHLTQWQSGLVKKNAIVGDKQGAPIASAQIVGDFCKDAVARNDGTRIELSARFPFGRLISLLDDFTSANTSKPQMLRPIRLSIKGKAD